MSRKAIGDRRFVITKNLIMMLVMLVVIIAAIFAWYSNNTEVTASGTSISAKASDEVELAVPDDPVEVNGNKVYPFPINNDSWSREIEFKKSGFLKDLVKDVTSDGQQFVVPNFSAAKNLQVGREVITDDVWVDGLSSKEALTNKKVNDDDKYNYISFDFYVRSKVNDIKVTADSFLAAGSEIDSSPKPLTGEDIYRCSTYGAAEGTANAFSADAIVGAMRVSLVGAPVDGVQTNNNVVTETTYNGNTWNNSAALKFLWLPRPDLYLKTETNANNWRLYTGIKPSDNTSRGEALTAAEVNNIANNTYVHSFYTGNTVSGNVKKGLTPGSYCDNNVKNVSGATSTDQFVVSDTRNDSNLGTTGHYPVLGQTKTIGNNALASSTEIRFNPGTEEGDNRTTTGYYVYKFTMNIWIEGEDAEARRSMNSGIFNLQIGFGN